MNQGTIDRKIKQKEAELNKMVEAWAKEEEITKPGVYIQVRIHLRKTPKILPAVAPKKVGALSRKGGSPELTDGDWEMIEVGGWEPEFRHNFLKKLRQSGNRPLASNEVPGFNPHDHNHYMIISRMNGVLRCRGLPFRLGTAEPYKRQEGSLAEIKHRMFRIPS